ncbi:MAG: hypothetical protein JXX28_03225 [Deltaproteobacteria bacterium]|nr:hypothetical protein [Deltaproteobacteria bacterium]
MRLFPLLLLTACAADGRGHISGEMGSHPFEKIVTAFHGGPFVALFDHQVSCEDTWWMDQSYSDQNAPDAEDGLMLQFTFQDDPVVGTLSVAGAGAVSASGIFLDRAQYEVFRGRDGTVTLDEVSEDDMVGTFAVTLSDGAVEGDFHSTWCRNMTP